MTGVLAAPDHVFDGAEMDETSFDYAKKGWHEQAMNRLPVKQLNRVLHFLQCDNITEACESLHDLGEQEYIFYLKLLMEQ